MRLISEMSATAVKSTIWKWSRHYMYGCFAKSWSGAFSGVDAYLGIAVGAAMSPEVIQAPNWEMIWYVFGVKFLHSAIRYFHENPLPPAFTTTDTIIRPNDEPKA